RAPHRRAHLGCAASRATVDRDRRDRALCRRHLGCGLAARGPRVASARVLTTGVHHPSIAAPAHELALARLRTDAHAPVGAALGVGVEAGARVLVAAEGRSLAVGGRRLAGTHARRDTATDRAIADAVA